MPARPLARLMFPFLAAILLALALTGHAIAQDAPVPQMPAIAAPQLPDLPADGGPGTQAPGAQPGPDLTPMGMYRAAHPVVKAVMILLALATIASWTVLLFKSVEIGLARAHARRSGRVLQDAATLDAAAGSLSQARDPAAVMAQAAHQELRRSAPALAQAGPAGVKERVRSLLSRIDAAAASHLRRGTGLLATIGAIAPFVGLFGTVWGIMNAFVGIAESKSSNLAVVAPGIAEALLATAIGLVAAIPAVVIYNIFTRRIAAYRLLLGDAAAAVDRLVSRDLDFACVPAKGDI